MNFDPVERAYIAVSKKDFTQVLSYLACQNGYIMGQDGRVASIWRAPMFVGLDFAARADKLRAALASAGSKIDVKLTDNFVVIKSGAYTGRVGRIPLADYPIVSHPADVTAWHACEALLPLLRRLRPFVSTDASKPWSLSMFTTEGRCWATNNVVIAAAETTLPMGLQIPVAAVDALLSIGEEPLRIGITDNVLWFEYDDGYLMSRTLADKWPSMDRFTNPKLYEDLHAVPVGIAAIIERIVPLVPDDAQPYIRFKGRSIATREGTHEAEIEIDDDLPDAMFHATPLLAVLKIAEQINFAAFPRVPFSGAGVRGIIAGVSG